MVRSQSLRRPAWLDLNQANRPRRRCNRAVNKQHRLRPRNIFRQIRSPLLPCNHQHAKLIAKPLFRPSSKPRPNAVIRAQRVAAGKNKTSGRSLSHLSMVQRYRITWSTTCPSWDSSESTSGIFPKACVEQLRQGSNVRITASTRFRTPSLNLPSFT